MNNKIDFVLIWVDGSDEEWKKNKSKYLKMDGKESRKELYRDWDILQYWFRGVEKYTPWVNKIHFVTCGHLPAWLNCDHPKLNIVKHSDFMPQEYLPTFSSHAIELNLHRIEGLEEQFVYFNDDMFIVDNMQSIDFFKNGIPRDSGIMSVLTPSVPQDPFVHYLANDLSLINHEFSKRKVLKKDFVKWFSFKYGELLLKNIYYAPIGRFSGFYNFHHPASFLKTTFKEVWEKEENILHSTSLNKFRTINDVNQYVFSYWQLASGIFCPRNTNISKFFTIGDNNKELFKCMFSRKYKMICINDSSSEIEFDEEKKILKENFNQLLPDKSKFEM